MRQVVRFVCDRCGVVHITPGLAENCEKRDIELKKQREEHKTKEKHWHDQGHDTWPEYNGMQHAPKVDPERFGKHNFADHDGTSDCIYGCGAWMGPARSGGPPNPFGRCPKNPIPAKKIERENVVGP